MSQPDSVPEPVAADSLTAVPRLHRILPAQQVEGSSYPRYDDIAQDGRIVPAGLIHLGETLLWSKLLMCHPFFPRMRSHGEVPILSRLVARGEVGPFSPDQPVDNDIAFELAHSRDSAGRVARIHLNVGFKARAPLDARRAGAAGMATVGSGFLEHTFTRLFAPPESRRMTQVEWEAPGGVPEVLFPAQRPEAVIDVQAPVEWLDEVWQPDSHSTLFGLVHTDLNQHVNSLVYPHIFEEAILRRLHRQGISTQVLSRFVDIAFRKPSFAGEEVRFWLRAFRSGSRLGAVGVLLAEGEPLELAVPGGRGRCYLRMVLEP